MKKITLSSIVFTSYALILAVLVTAYMGEDIHYMNFYILPILFGAYYFNVYGGVGLALLSTVLSILFMHKAGHLVYDTPMISQIIIFVIIGIVAGMFQKENNKLNNYLFKASLTDKLTGLYNYGYFTKRIAEEISRADRYKRSFGLIMIDIDHFKNYNDTYGHQKGNQVLVKIAEIILKNLRQSDIAFRYGGEEFTIILPETSEDAVNAAERLRKSIEEEIFPGNVKITISAGVSVYPFIKDSKSSIVEQADSALYKAKESGRNKVCV